MENQEQDLAKNKSAINQQQEHKPGKGLDDWNDRLDENIEPDEQNDAVADKNAKDFSEKFGSGDQSDDSGK